MMAKDLHPGVRVMHGTTPCTILSTPRVKADPLGRPTLCIQARREDTGAEGTILYGERAQVWLVIDGTILIPGDPGYDDAKPQVVPV